MASRLCGAFSQSQHASPAIPHGPTYTLHGPAAQWRLELFFKSPEDLCSQIPFLKRHNITRINLTNKSNDDRLLDSARMLQQAMPGVDLCVHYSMKYNYDRSPAGVFEKLQAFCDDLQQQMEQPAAETGAAVQQASCHVLLVSGGGKKKSFDSIAALQQMQQQQRRQQQPAGQQAHDTGGLGSDGNVAGTSAATAAAAATVTRARTSKKRLRTPAAAAAAAEPTGTSSPSAAAGSTSGSCSSWPSMAVAFNPYLPAQEEAEAERARLRAKLATGLVTRVYLQMGTDLAALASGLSYAQGLCRELYGQAGQPLPQLLGSVFIPSKRLLAQMKFRPWNGVFLSEEYLSSVGAAEAITRQLLDAYAAAGVVPLVESALKKNEEMQYVLELLSGESASPRVMSNKRLSPA